VFQVFHWTGAGAFEWDSQNALALLETLWDSTGEVAKEGVKCGQSNVSCRGLVSPVTFQMIEESEDELRAEVIKVDAGELPSSPGGYEAKQKRESVAIAPNGMRTDASHGREMTREEVLDGGGQGVGILRFHD
jgi:hypothetical protein